jgi:hypothetical protein
MFSILYPEIFIWFFLGVVYKMAFDTIEWILIMALSIALICSLVISWRVYIMKDGHYKQGFSTWQMPMIFAILADLYLIR